MEAIPERPELEVEESMQERKKAKDQEWANWQLNPTSKTVEEGKKVVKIACGENFVLALRASGEVWACSVIQQSPGPWIYVSFSPSSRNAFLTEVAPLVLWTGYQTYHSTIPMDHFLPRP
jgi:hypothetical protein